MIAETFIRRPVTAIVISIVIVLVGIISLTNLPVAQYPDISPPTVSVSASFIGADAETVEETTTTPLETQINGSPGMTYITGNSSASGQGSVTATFEVGTNIDIAALDVQNRVSVAVPRLPDIVRRLGVTVRKRNPTNIAVLAFYSPNGTHDIAFIDNYVNIYIQDALKRVKGVGDITAFGNDFSMRIWLEPEKLAALGLSPADVSAAINDQNLQVSAGTLGGTPQPSSQAFEYTVLTNSRLNTVDQFKNIIIKANPGTGQIVYLKDIARVELGQFSYGHNSLVNGKPASFMLVYQTPEANALETYAGVLKALESMKKTFPKDFDYLIPSETVSVVKTSIKEVVETLLEALALVVFVVFLFLQNWRATLIPVLAIPVSLIGTFIFFAPLGFTINTLTLFAFVLAIGIVVDDAIIVVEAVQHNIDHFNMSPKEATRKAMKEISAPVIAIALILAAVFIPVGFMPGIVGKLYQQFAITIAVSVIISAFVALSLTPALCSIMLKHTDEQKKHRDWLAKFFAAFNRGFGKMNASYSKSVGSWIKKAPYVLVMLAVMFVGLFFLFKAKPTGFIPTEDEGRMYVTYELPEAASTTRSLQLVRELSDSLLKIPEISVAGGLAGFNIISFSNKPNVGTIFVMLKPWDERKGEAHNAQSVVAKIMKSTAHIKDAKIMAILPPAVPGLGRTSGFSLELQQTTSTDDLNTFAQVARDFIGQLNQRPEIGGAYTFFTANTPSYMVNVDRDKAKQLGVKLADIYATISSYLGSNYINDFTLYGRNFRVVSQADSVSRSSLEEIGKYYVRNSAGSMIPLSSLMTTKLIESPSTISHYNIYRSISVNGTPAEGYSSGQAIEAIKETAAKFLPSGYSYEFSGMSREEISAGNKTSTIFAISLVFVFLFLAALYESWSVPFSVLFAVPIGALGSILVLTFIPSISNNIYAQIGLITLIGLAAKNAILIVEFAKERVDSGMELIKATIAAVHLRLRPILMTSFAFILGVLPLAFATGAASESRRTIGWTVFGGMLAATSLAIFVVPVLYVLITRAAYGKKKLAALQANYKPEEHKEFEEDV